MKPILLPVLCLTLIIAGCGTVRPGSTAADAVTLIIVEYRYDRATEQSVRQILQLRRVSDWSVSKQGTEETIEARYKELSADMVAEIDTRLRRIPAVLRVDVKKDGVPVRNPN